MVELWSMVIGFVVGLVAAGIAVEFGLKKLLAPPDRSKLTTVWSLGELEAPLVVTTGIDGVSIPRSARVVTATELPPEALRGEIRTNRDVKGNFAVDARRDRAILFLGGASKGALALWTVDERLIARLRAEFNRVWTRSLDYVEKVRIADISGKPHARIETTGAVEGIVPWKEKYMLRLLDEGEAVGVVVDTKLEVVGRRVRVTGIVKPSSSGFPLIEALEVAAA